MLESDKQWVITHSQNLICLVKNYMAIPRSSAGVNCLFGLCFYGSLAAMEFVVAVGMVSYDRYFNHEECSQWIPTKPHIHNHSYSIEKVPQLLNCQSAPGWGHFPSCQSVTRLSPTAKTPFQCRHFNREVCDVVWMPSLVARTFYSVPVPESGGSGWNCGPVRQLPSTITLDNPYGFEELHETLHNTVMRPMAVSSKVLACLNRYHERAVDDNLLQRSYYYHVHDPLKFSTHADFSYTCNRFQRRQTNQLSFLSEVTEIFLGFLVLLGVASLCVFSLFGECSLR